MTLKKIEVLADYLNIANDDVKLSKDVFETPNDGEYIVLDESEADEAVYDYVENSIEYFNPDFIYDNSTVLQEAQDKIDELDDMFIDEDEDEENFHELNEDIFDDFYNKLYDDEKLAHIITSDYGDISYYISNGDSNKMNEHILLLIDDLDDFVEEAIRLDGRGHFLSSYDGAEIELEDGYFAYRIN